MQHRRLKITKPESLKPSPSFIKLTLVISYLQLLIRNVLFHKSAVNKQYLHIHFIINYSNQNKMNFPTFENSLNIFRKFQSVGTFIFPYSWNTFEASQQRHIQRSLQYFQIFLFQITEFLVQVFEHANLIIVFALRF